MILEHPLGLRALQDLAGLGLEGEAELEVPVSVLHVLECRGEVEEVLARARRPRLVFTLQGPLSFAAGELARLAPGVSHAQLEAAVGLLLEWSRKFDPSVEARITPALVGVSSATHLEDLRMHLDGLKRHGFVVDPVASADGSLPGDDRVGEIVALVRGQAAAADRMEALAQLLDEAAGKARGPSRRHLRLLPSLRQRGTPPPTTRQIECTRPDDPRPPRRRASDAIVAVREAARLGAKVLVIGGEEPTAEWYLDDLVLLARGLGLGRIVLVTDAIAAAEAGRAAALAQAGVTGARVKVGPLDAAAPATRAGLRALLDAGVAVELVVDVAPGTGSHLAEVARRAGVLLPATRARVEKILARVAADLPLLDATRALADGVRAARESGAAIEVDAGTELPPCVFDDAAEVQEILRLSEGLVARDDAMRHYARIAACEGCGARHVCPGPLHAREREVSAVARPLAPGAPGIPPTEERRQVLHEMKSVILRSNRDGSVEERRVLRVNFHCNQACDFCFVSRQLPAPEEELIERELEEAARHRASLALSGGEPTLNPRLPHYVARARELGIKDLELQTNAIKMSDRSYAATLAAAGLDLAFVSLHGTTRATSDRVTSAPGTFDKTLEGIRNLLREGVMVRANFVLCGYNVGEFASLPDFVDRELRSVPGARVQINFSFVAPSSNVPRDAALVPRFSDVAWALEGALSRCEALGITMVGFDSQCGVPPCFLPARVRETAFPEDLPLDEVRAFEGSFRKGEACTKCAMSARCYGVRAGYAEMYGTEELRAVEA